MQFFSPSRGWLAIEDMYHDIYDFMCQMPNEQYSLIIGSDSQTRDDVTFVTAVIIHRQGKGAKYYYNRQKHRKIASLRQKIFYETSLSLGVASKMTELMAGNGMDNVNVEIHLDIGSHGSTKDLIREIVGMVVGSGFDAKIKPDSYGASKVADKHTK